MAGKQFLFLSDGSGESLEAGWPVNNESLDWVMVVGKERLQGPLTAGPCV